MNFEISRVNCKCENRNMKAYDKNDLEYAIRTNKIPTLFEEEKKPHSDNGQNGNSPNELKDVLKKFMEDSSFHGIPKMASSPHIAVKVLWCLLFLAAFGLLTYQGYGLVSTYVAKPVGTTISLEFSQLRFPAVTFCNMNPVKKSKMTPELKQAILVSNKETSRRKRSIIDDPIGSLETDATMWNNADHQFKDMRFNGLAEDPSSCFDCAPELYPSDSINVQKFTQNLEYLETMMLHDRHIRSASSSGTSGSAPVPTSGSGSASVSNSNAASNSASNSYAASSSGSALPPSSGSSNSGSTLSPSSTVPTMSSSDYYSSSSSDSYYPSSSYAPEVQQVMNAVLSGERDDWETIRRRFHHRFKSMPVENRTSIGHRVEDMVIQSTFMGFNKNESTFKRLATAEYGNCYTIDDSLYRAWRSGPANGIWLTLNIEKDEYVAALNSGYGARIVFHEPGTLPLPSQEGILLSPGTETNVALKMVHLTRLGDPYGKCTDGEMFTKEFNIKYTTASCFQICRSQLILDICGCLPFDAPEVDLDSTAPVCNMLNMQVEKCVLFSVDNALAAGNLECDCPVACHEIVYEKTLSWRTWPSDDYMERVLLGKLCDNMKTPSYKLFNDCYDPFNENSTCNSSKDFEVCGEDYTMEPSEWSSNFLRVVIYYEALDYERIVESPSYEIFRFASDIGGTAGLCIGASLLSLAEGVHLAVEVFLWCYKRRKPQISAY